MKVNLDDSPVEVVSLVFLALPHNVSELTSRLLYPEECQSCQNLDPQSEKYKNTASELAFRSSTHFTKVSEMHKL